MAPSPISIAPMMDWTNRHYRAFMRAITTRTLLYTEMITASAIIHGDRDHLLGFDRCEHPLALQLGGDDPAQVAEAVRIASDYGYDEFNLNVGCPSDRVQSGHFGACLMAHPDRVARIVAAMQHATDRPVTVKQRIGIDGRESYEPMLEFVDRVAAAGVNRFTVHARIAVLGGLSPKENRTIPPLRYEDVYRLKRMRPRVWVELNGGVRDHPQIAAHLQHVDAVMLGRAAYECPYLFADVDRRYFGATTDVASRQEIVERYRAYCAAAEAAGVPPHRLVRHMLGLFAGRPGARAWKRALSGKRSDHSARELIAAAIERVPEHVRRERPITTRSIGRELVNRSVPVMPTGA